MAKGFSLMLGIALMGIGVWGWVSGGHNHELIVFGINFTHNAVHLLSGVLALAASAYGEKSAKAYCFVFGTVYGLVTVAGFLNIDAVVQRLNLNHADNFLHLAIAVACLIAAAQPTSIPRV